MECYCAHSLLLDFAHVMLNFCAGPQLIEALGGHAKVADLTGNHPSSRR